MLCPECGSPSEVIETRPFRQVFLRRRRRCTRGHPFSSYEVTEEQLIPTPREKSSTELRKLAAHMRQATESARYDALCELIIAEGPDADAAGLAQALECSLSFVYKCRRNAFPKKIRHHS